MVSKGLIRTRKLSKSINSEIKNDSVTIGAIPFYAQFLERGAKPHTIKRKKGFLYWSGARHPVRSVKHPGVKKTKFLSGPIDEMSKSGKIESLFSRGVSEALSRVGV